MVEDTIVQAVTIIQLIIQYLLQPRNFLLTFFLPVAFCFINRRFIWLSVLITIAVELVVNWGNFTYYESQGLMIFFTLVQVAVMAIFILMLNFVGRRIPKRPKG